MNKALVLLHGFLSYKSDFDALIPYVQDSYSHIAVPIYPGHDGNYHEFDCISTLDCLEKDFRALSSRYEEIDIIGFSMGGTLAMYLASRFPVNKLVLLAPCNKYFNFLMPYIKFRYILKNFFIMEKAFLTRNREEYQNCKRKLKMMFVDDIKAIRVARDKYLKIYIRKAFKQFRMLIKIVNDTQCSIECPCFIAWGELDQLVPKKSVLDLYTLCRHQNRKLNIYEDLSHLMLYSEDNTRLINDIITFLHS